MKGLGKAWQPGWLQLVPAKATMWQQGGSHASHHKEGRLGVWSTPL